MTSFASSGSEAVEYALKLAEKTRGERKRVVYAEKAFHGKTRGSLSVTDSTLYRDTFSLLDTPVRVPFGDAAALRAVIAGDRSIGTLILETVQGGAGIITAPLRLSARGPRHLQRIRRGLDRRPSTVRCWPHRPLLRLRAHGRL